MRYIALLLFSWLVIGCAAPNLTLVADSPKSVTEHLMGELFKSERDLLRDEKFKRKYCSLRLRREIDEAYQATISNPVPKDQPPTGLPLYEDRFNTTILNAWDIPTSYKVGEMRQDASSASVEVSYLWGAGTQYSGDTRRTSVRLANENGSWKIDDLVTHKGESTDAGSLRESLQRAKENALARTRGEKPLY